MKICPNCHKLSKDDDFCSHCGSAVYGDDNYTGNESINCDNYKDHDHKKQTFSEGRYSEKPIVNDPDYKGKDFTKMSDKPADRKKNKGCGSVIAFIVMFFIFIAVIEDMGVDLGSLAEAIIDMLSDLF